MLRRHRQLRTQVHVLLDASLFAVALWVAHLIRAHWKIQIWGGMADIGTFEVFSPLLLLIVPLAPNVLASQGFYSRPLLSSSRNTAWILAKSCAITTLLVILAIFLVRAQGTLARSVIVLFGGISFAMVFLKEELVRWGLKSTLGQSQFKKRLLLVGTPEETNRLRAEMAVKSQEEIQIVFELDLNQASVDRLVSLLHEHSVNGVLINAKHTYFDQVEKAIQACELEGVEAWLVADFFKTQISRTTVDDFYGRPILVFRSAPETSWQALVKQAFDFIGAVVLVLLTSLIMLVAAILIKLTSPGPVFFRQMRSGLNGQPFVMYKFRSMVTNAEQLKHEISQLNEMSGPVFKVTNDPRITPIGRWLRKSSIDEFPQLFNVVRGEMSLVGPRPLPVDEVQRFDDMAHRRRLSVKPGITCLWQVSGRNQVSDFKDWVRLDLEYIDNWSLWLDFKILWRTIPVVLLARGAK